MTKTGSNKTAILASLGKERFKTKYFYDVSGRNTYVVQAPVEAEDGDPALVTKFEYTNDETYPTSSREYVKTWQAAWDITETDPS